MPIYTYRREDGTTFDIKQKFLDSPLTTDPETGQRVTRVVHAAGIIFKGSGFYVNDSKSATRSSSTPVTNNKDSAKDSGDSGTGKAEAKTETKTESKPEKSTAPSASAAAD